MFFEPVQQILIADQFAEVRILLPFPEFLPKLDEKIANVSMLIRKLRMTDNLRCNFDNDNASQVDGIAETWLLSNVKSEYDAARADLAAVRSDLQFLMREPPGTMSTRDKRFTPVFAAGAAAAVFGLGLGIGSKLDCGIKGIFGSCPDMSKENKANIRKVN